MLVYDPEMVGYVLREIVEVPTGDFQDLRLWRRQVADLAVGLVEEYERPVLVPMALVNPGYVREIFGALKDAGIDVHHFFPQGLPRGPGEADRRPELPSDTVFLDGEVTPQELADQVLARVQAGGASGT